MNLKRVFSLAWPISLQNVLVTLLGMVDVVMVGHLGNAAVASVGLGNRVQFVLLIIVMGLAWGVGVLSSQFFGAGKIHKIRQSLLMALTYAFLALTPIVIANFWLADDVIMLASTDAMVIDIGEQYLWITIPSLLMVAVIMIVENAIRSVNQVMLPMLFSVVAIAINIVLNYWLINGGWGIEALGVEGAAWATAIARIIHVLALVGFLLYSKHLIAPKSEDLLALKVKKDWVKLFNLVWPMMISFGIWSVGTFVYQLIYGRLGTTELAVMSLLSPVEGLFLSLFFGFASACSILVGQQLGADKFEDAWKIAKGFALTCPAIALLLGAVLMLLEPVVFSPYSEMPQQTLDMAHGVFILIAFGAWIKVFNMVLAMGLLRAGGDNKWCMYTDITGMWIVAIPLTYYVATQLQLPLVWVALAAYSEEAVKLFLFGSRAASKRWMNNLAHKHS